MSRSHPTGFARLATCDDGAHHGVNQEDSEPASVARRRQLMVEAVQQNACRAEQDQKDCEGRRNFRGRQPKSACRNLRRPGR